MRALRYYGQRDIRVEEVEEPVMKDGWVKIRPAYVGICGSDLHEYMGGHNLIPRPVHPHSITNETSPVIMGHEFSGVIEEVGEGIDDLTPGQNVCIQPTIYCNECHACRNGLDNACTKLGFVGLTGWGGGLSDHVVVPRAAVWKLPSNVSLECGALVEPLAVGYHAVAMAPIAHPIPPTKRILVLGSGPIGLAVIQSIHAQAASPESPPLIIVSEPSKTRQQFARDFGVEHVINPITTDLLAQVLELTNGSGVDLVLDCAGVQVGVDQGLKCLCTRGTLLNVAVWENRATLDMNEITFREKCYMGSATYNKGDFQEVIKAVEDGRIKPGAMITRKIALGKVEDEGFRALIEEKDLHMKILVDMEKR